jgi:RNA polymerase sigma-32 factor
MNQLVQIGDPEDELQLDVDDGQDDDGRADDDHRRDASGARDDDGDGDEIDGDDIDDAEVNDAELVDEDGSKLPKKLLRRTAGAAIVSSKASLAERDPLAAYMRDVHRYKLLTPEQEHTLAVRYAEDGDLDAARELVTSNLRLVVKIAYDYRQAYKNLLDLVQEGNIGLMQAVKKYDPYKGVKLSSYAAWWIRAYMLRFILNNHRLVKVGTTQAQRKLFFNLKKEKARLSAMGIEPTSARIAERLNVPEHEVISMDRRLSAGEASLDAPVGSGDGRQVSRIELVPGGGAGMDDVLAEQQLGDQMKAKIHEFGELLEGKEQRIFEERLLAEDPRTLQDLGTEFGVSRERVRQIEKRLLGKLRDYLSSELGQAVIDVYEPS